MRRFPQPARRKTADVQGRTFGRSFPWTAACAHREIKEKKEEILMGRHEGLADEIVEIIRKEDEDRVGMARELRTMCRQRDKCDGCPLIGAEYDCDFDGMPDSALEDAYERAFGAREQPDRGRIMMRIAELWTAYTSYEFDARDVAMLLALTKVAEVAEDECGSDVYAAAADGIQLAGEIGGKG
jgi:hypothetical protein